MATRSWVEGGQGVRRVTLSSQQKIVGNLGIFDLPRSSLLLRSGLSQIRSCTR